MQYIIGKLSDIVFMRKEGLIVAALLESVRESWKVAIYYINEAFLKLNCYTLYIGIAEQTGQNFAQNV